MSFDLVDGAQSAKDVAAAILEENTGYLTMYDHSSEAIWLLRDDQISCFCIDKHEKFGWVTKRSMR